MRSKSLSFFVLSVMLLSLIGSVTASTPMQVSSNSDLYWDIDTGNRFYYTVDISTTYANLSIVLGFEVDRFYDDGVYDYVAFKELVYNNETNAIEYNPSSIELTYKFSNTSDPSYIEVYDPYENAFSHFYDVFPYIVYPCNTTLGGFDVGFFTNYSLYSYEQVGLSVTDSGVIGSDYYVNYTSPSGNSIDLIVNGSGILMDATIHFVNRYNPVLNRYENVTQHYSFSSNESILVTTDDHDYIIPSQGLVYKKEVNGKFVGLESFNITRKEFEPTAKSMAPNPTVFLYAKHYYYDFDTSEWIYDTPPWENKEYIIGSSTDNSIYSSLWFSETSRYNTTVVTNIDFPVRDNEIVVTNIENEENDLTGYYVIIQSGLSSNNVSRIVMTRHIDTYMVLQIEYDDDFNSTVIAKLNDGDEIIIESRSGFSFASNIIHPNGTTGYDMKTYYEPVFRNYLNLNGASSATTNSCTFTSLSGDSLYIEITEEGYLAKQEFIFQSDFPFATVTYTLVTDIDNFIDSVTIKQWNVNEGDEIIYKYERANGTWYENTYGMYKITHIGYQWTESLFDAYDYTNAISAEYYRWIPQSPNSFWDVEVPFLSHPAGKIGRDLLLLVGPPSELVYTNDITGSDLLNEYQNILTAIGMNTFVFNTYFFNCSGTSANNHSIWYNITFNNDRIVIDFDVHLEIENDIYDWKMVKVDKSSLPESRSFITFNVETLGFTVLVTYNITSDDGFTSLRVDWGDGTEDHDYDIDPLHCNDVWHILHHYSEAGTYLVTFYLTDGQNDTVYQSFQVTVEPLGFEERWGVRAGQEFIYNDNGTYVKYRFNNFYTYTYEWSYHGLNGSRYRYMNGKWDMDEDNKTLGGFSDGFVIAPPDYIPPLIIPLSIDEPTMERYYRMVLDNNDKPYNLSYVNRTLIVETVYSNMTFQWDNRGVLIMYRNNGTSSHYQLMLVKAETHAGNNVTCNKNETESYFITFYYNPDIVNGTYTLYRNGSHVSNGLLSNEGIIGFSIEGLNEGVYNYTFVVEDAFGQTSSASVIVTILSSEEETEETSSSLSVTTWIIVSSIGIGGGIGLYYFAFKKKSPIGNIGSPSYCKLHPNDPRCK